MASKLIKRTDDLQRQSRPAKDRPLSDDEAAAVVARAKQLDLRDHGTGCDDAVAGRPVGIHWMMGGGTRGWGRRWS